MRRLLMIAAALGAFGSALIAQDVGAKLRDTPPEAESVKPNLTPEARADIYMARKEYREAIDKYKEVQPPNAVVLNKIGIAHHHLMDFVGAKKYYQMSMKANPKYPEPINNLGTVFYAQKNHRRAIGLYKKALALAPNSASIHSNLGTAYFARNNLELAAKEWSTALSLDADVFEHRNTHGVLLQERTVQERAKYYFFLAKMYARTNQDDRALLYMRKAIEEGFKDRAKFSEDGDFARLKANPEFVELLKLEPRVL